ncbi:MAG: hypothetical protein GWP48_07405 [Actinobacteria bacterium]|nr:hypothetical protein [Actinomycetota bacterium]
MRNSPRPLFFRALVTLAALIVLAAGCGSGGESSDADTGSETEVSTEPETSPDDAGDDDSVIDEEEPESAADKSASIATYCEANAANDAAFENMNPADPESVRNLVLKSRNGLRDVIPRAPEEIRDDLATVLVGFEKVIEILRTYEFDFFAASSEIEEVSDSPVATAAEDRLDAWEAANCPTAPDEDGDGSDFEDAMESPEFFLAMIETESGREMVLDGITEDGDLTREQATCLIDHPDFIEFFTLMSGGEEPSAEMIPTIFGLLDECDIPLEALADLGPGDPGEDNSEGGSDFEDAMESPEFFLAMIETESGREMVLDGMTEEGDLTREQATCLIDHPDFIEFISLASGEEPSVEMIPMIFGLLDECGIPLEALDG